MISTFPENLKLSQSDVKELQKDATVLPFGLIPLIVFHQLIKNAAVIPVTQTSPLNTAWKKKQVRTREKKF